MTGTTKGERQRDWINAAIENLAPKDAWKTTKIESIYRMLAKLSPTTQFTLLRIVVKKLNINLSDAKAHFKTICNELMRDEDEDETEPTTTSSWYQEKDDAGWWCVRRMTTKLIERIDPKTSSKTEEYVDELMSHILNYHVIGRAENNAGRIVYLAEDNVGCFDIIDPDFINTQLADVGVTDPIIRDVKRFFAISPAIQNVPAYGFNQHTFRQFYLPPNFYAKGMTGLGTSFIRYFRACLDPTKNDAAVNAYKNILHEIAKNIGDANTYTIVGFTFASLGRDYAIDQVNIMPLLHCKGAGGKGKTAAVKAITNVGNLPKDIQEENAETAESPAVFSQLLSSGYYPIIIEEPQGDSADVFKKILPILLQLATTPYSRRRLTASGHVRDDITAYRSPLIISNFDVTAFNDPQASSRIIELLFTHIKKDNAKWTQLIHAYTDCGGSILAWIAFHVIDLTFPDMKQLFADAWTLTNKIGREQYKDIEDRSHLKVIPIIWGLFMLQTLFHYFEKNEQFIKTCYVVYRACNATSPGGHVAVNILVSACRIFYERFIVWKQSYKQIRGIERDILKKREEMAHETDPGKVVICEEIITKMKTVLHLNQKEAADLQSKGLCKIVSIRGTDWYAITDDNLPRLRKEMGDVNFSCQTKTQLRDFLQSVNVSTEGQPIHIPWIPIDREDVTQTQYCVCFPVRPFTAIEDLGPVRAPPLLPPEEK